MKRYDALDSWRGICALVVALHHFPFINGVTSLSVVRNGYLFVDFFFVLSGFVISHAWRGDEPVAFIRRRIARLWPLHLTVLAAFMAFEALRYELTGHGFDNDRSLASVIPNALLLHGFGGPATWNVPSWSISVEMGLYLSFVGFIWLPQRLRAPVAAVFVIIGLTVLAALSPHGMNATTDFGWARGLAGFYAGYLTRQARLTRSSTLAEVAVVAAVAAFVSLPAGAVHLAAPIVFAFAVRLFSRENGWLSRGLLHVQQLGRWSYSIYMNHYLIAAVLAGAVNRGMVAEGWWLLPIYILVTVAASAATYRLVEVPGQALGRRPVVRPA